MSTRIWGASDDLVEIDGDVRGEEGSFDTDTLLVCSDGSILSIEYGKLGVWKITIIRQGDLYERLEVCDDPDADVYSDIAHFKDNMKWVIAAQAWNKVD